MNKLTPKDLFLLTWKKALIIIVLEISGILLHNLISGLFKIEEPVFFILAVTVIPVYLITSIVYSLIYFVKKR